MSLHIAAKTNEIAETVLISGDPLRAKYFAEQMLTNVVCYNEVRGMLGFTGLYKGKRVSIQGTGMGIPSTAIYVHELIHDYGVKKLIRIGTCGAIQPTLPLWQLILATGAYSDSGTNLLYNGSLDFMTEASSGLLAQARETAQQQAIPTLEGPVFSTDSFYNEEPNRWDKWTNLGVLAVEMESSILYTLAARNNVEALSILLVTDNILTQELATAKEREQVNQEMMTLALEIA